MVSPYLKFFAAPACALTAFAGLLAIAPKFTQAQTNPSPPATATCAFDPNLGKPNPLGMRSYITLSETEGNTTVVYDVFPSPVSSPNQSPRPVTISSRREMIFYNTNIAAARQLLLDEPIYYSTLLNSTRTEDFAAVNAVLTCRNASSSPTRSSPIASPPAVSPTASPTASPTSSSSAYISSLPDGNYRFWTGRPTRGTTVTDEELLQKGGILFLFKKTGNQIVGNYAQVDNIGICLSGQIDQNTLTGTAVQQGDAEVLSDGDRFVAWDPAGLLRVRRGVKTDTIIRYGGAIADLRSFARINAGDRAPVSRCP